jgi:hypothetical protein
MDSFKMVSVKAFYDSVTNFRFHDVRHVCEQLNIYKARKEDFVTWSDLNFQPEKQKGFFSIVKWFRCVVVLSIMGMFIERFCRVR